jgi:hypothetical protein
VLVEPWPGRLLGLRAADVLLARIRGDTGEPRRLVLPGDQALDVGESAPAVPVS